MAKDHPDLEVIKEGHPLFGEVLEWNAATGGYPSRAGQYTLTVARELTGVLFKEINAVQLPLIE